MKKNVYKAHEVTVGSEKHTRYDVDVDTLSESDDWKNYKRMELNPGDTIHLSDGSILKVVEDDAGEECCDACALTWGVYEIHKIEKFKEAALCMMCDCGDTRESAPFVHLEEVSARKKTTAKNRFMRCEKRLSDGTSYTNWHVDLDSLDSDIDWKHYERMDLKPGDMVITDSVVMTVLGADHKTPCSNCCLALFNDGTLDNHTKKMLCDICDCNKGHGVYLQEVN